MSKELLAKVAFAAMNGDADEAELIFDQFIKERDDLDVTAKECKLEEVAKGCVAVLSGENEFLRLEAVASELGYDLYQTGQNGPNEDKTMEEERAESYNESASQ